MASPVNDTALDTIFRLARTHRVWLDRPVPDDLLRQLYDLMKFGPTSSNCCPARLVFVRTPEAKERLKPTLAPGNVDKTMKAPVTAIVAYDLNFFEALPRLSPASPDLKDLFAKDPALAEVAAMRNGSLQGGYFILAARSLGLDCGPMSGFDNAKLDAEFFPANGNDAAGASFPGGRLKSNFLCNLGYGDPSKLRPRQPRLEFSEACQIL